MKVSELKSLTNGLKKRETYLYWNSYVESIRPLKKIGVERRKGCFFAHNFCEKETSCAPSKTVSGLFGRYDKVKFETKYLLK